MLIKDLVIENHLSIEEILDQDFFDFLEIMNSKKEDLIEDPRNLLQAFG